MKLVKLRAVTGQVLAVCPADVVVVCPTNDLNTAGLVIRGLQQPMPVMGTSNEVADWLNGDRDTPPGAEPKEPPLLVRGD